MTQGKHTPAPWHVGKDADEGEGRGWFVGGGGYCRAHMVGPISDTEANARLIAAAPDMLEALIAARAELEAYELDASGEGYNNPTLNAAIAKATGDSK